MEGQRVYQRIRDARRIYPFTNIYSTDAAAHANQVWEGKKGFLFSFEDHGVNRLGFFVEDKNELPELLRRVEVGRYYLEYMTKDEKEFIPGLQSVARMKRLANPDCRTVFEESGVLLYQDNAIGEMAKPEDAPEINRLLWSVFHTEVSHLLWDDELAASIRKGQITVHRDGGIDAVLMADVMPRKFYINQIVNQGEKKIIHAMLLNRLARYIENGGKYLYAWVEEGNTASMKFHAKYGMKHDGMWDMIWLLER